MGSKTSNDSMNIVLSVLTITSLLTFSPSILTAVAGLPEPRRDHAVAIARFARDILSKMHVLTKELEVTLGPDTGELALRIGIHSGPVTAGVLRGKSSYFSIKATHTMQHTSVSHDFLFNQASGHAFSCLATP